MIVDAHAHIFSRPCSKVAPSSSPDATFPAEQLIALMDSAGVERALLLQNPFIGIINDEIGAAVASNPSRFAGVIQVDPLDPRAPETLRQFRRPGMRTVKLEMSGEWGWSGMHPGIQLDGPEMNAFWRAVAELDLNVVIDPGPVDNAGYQVEAIEGLADRTRGCVVIEHLAYPQPSAVWDKTTRERRTRLLASAKHPQVFLGLSAVPTLIEDDYPCRESLRLLEEACDLVGPGKLLWGSDAPGTLRRHSYRQLIDWVAEDCGFLSQVSKDQILGGNAASIFFSER